MTIKLCQWDITGACNLNCTYCREKSTSGFRHLSKDQMLGLIDQMSDMDVRMVMIAGGEPLTLKFLPDILAYAKSKIGHVGISTNGTLVDERAVDYLKKYCSGVQISLDGSHAEIHDAFRGSGSFEKTVAAIQLLRSQGVNVMTRLTICRENRKDTGAYVRFVHSLGLASAYLRRAIPAGNFQKGDVLAPEDLYESFQDAFETGHALGMHIGSADYFSQLTFDANERAKAEASLAERPHAIVSGCSIGVDAFYLAQDGRVLFCPYLPVLCGDMTKETLTDIWAHSKMFKISRNLRRNQKGKCGKCRFNRCCGGCPAYIFRTTGDLTESDYGCWIDEPASAD